jgi:hypothetical protein
MAGINWKGTTQNELRPRTSGRDNGAAGTNVGRMGH